MNAGSGRERAPGPRPAARPGVGRATHPGPAARGARTARAPGAGRQATDELERPDDHGPRRRRAPLGEPGYLEAASTCADFLLRELRDGRGRLLRTYNDGHAKIDAYLEDHAFLLEALIALFEASCEERWFDEATALAEEMIARFADPERGGFFSTASDGEALIARRKDLEDTPIPSGGSSAALGLLRLAELTGDAEYERHAISVLGPLSEHRPPSSERVRTRASGDALAHLSDAPDRLSDPSEDRQVAVELPLGDLHPVVLPLLSLDLHVAVEHVLAERPQHEL